MADDASSRHPQPSKPPPGPAVLQAGAVKPLRSDPEPDDSQAWGGRIPKPEGTAEWREGGATLRLTFGDSGFSEDAIVELERNVVRQLIASARQLLRGVEGMLQDLDQGVEDVRAGLQSFRERQTRTLRLAWGGKFTLTAPASVIVASRVRFDVRLVQTFAPLQPDATSGHAGNSGAGSGGGGGAGTGGPGGPTTPATPVAPTVSGESLTDARRVQWIVSQEVEIDEYEHSNEADGQGLHTVNVPSAPAGTFVLTDLSDHRFWTSTDPVQLSAAEHDADVYTTARIIVDGFADELDAAFAEFRKKMQDAEGLAAGLWERVKRALGGDPSADAAVSSDGDASTAREVLREAREALDDAVREKLNILNALLNVWGGRVKLHDATLHLWTVGAPAATGVEPPRTERRFGPGSFEPSVGPKTKKEMGKAAIRTAVIQSIDRMLEETDAAAVAVDVTRKSVRLVEARELEQAYGARVDREKKKPPGPEEL